MGKEVEVDKDTGEIVSGELQKETKTHLDFRKTHLKCDSCYLASRGCPKYKPGSDCSMEWDEIFTYFGPQEGTQHAIVDLLQTQYKRIKRGEAQEEASGGLIDKSVSEEITRFFQMLKTLKQLNVDEEVLFIKSSKPRGKSQDKGLLQQFLEKNKE